MTLQDGFQWLAAHQEYAWFYFLGLPLTALLANLFGRGEGNLSPWVYLYAALIWLVCVPGIFSLTLNIYLFLFERRSVLQTDIFVQLLPIFSMFSTVLLVKNNADLTQIPSFGKLGGLVTIIAGTLFLMWFVDRTHIVAFISMNIWQVLGIFMGLLLVVRWGWSRLAQ
jgi:hypothetical protein